MRSHERVQNFADNLVRIFKSKYRDKNHLTLILQCKRILSGYIRMLPAASVDLTVLQTAPTSSLKSTSYNSIQSFCHIFR